MLLPAEKTSHASSTALHIPHHQWGIVEVNCILICSFMYFQRILRHCFLEVLCCKSALHRYLSSISPRKGQSNKQGFVWCRWQATICLSLTCYWWQCMCPQYLHWSKDCCIFVFHWRSIFTANCKNSWQYREDVAALHHWRNLRSHLQHIHNAWDQ